MFLYGVRIALVDREPSRNANGRAGDIQGSVRALPRLVAEGCCGAVQVFERPWVDVFYTGTVEFHGYCGH